MRSYETTGRNFLFIKTVSVATFKPVELDTFNGRPWTTFLDNLDSFGRVWTALG